jgi:hypothetical protein
VSRQLVSFPASAGTAVTGLEILVEKTGVCLGSMSRSPFWGDAQCRNPKRAAP